MQVDKDDIVWKYTVSSEADKINVLPGEHIIVHRETTDDGANFTIDAVQFPVKIDGDSADVLYGDGTPNDPLGVYDFVGATAQDDGKPGAVPAPTKDELNYYLKGDGTWALEEFSGIGTSGFVPTPTMGDADKVLASDGTWIDMTNNRPCTIAEMAAWIDEVDYYG